MEAISSYLAALIFAPLMFGIINKVKAIVAGRHGPPILQLYFDLIKLLKKDLIYSKTTTYIFKYSSVIIFVLILVVLSFFPLGKGVSIFGFSGDIILCFYLLALQRFFIILSALDTGSSFEGMGSSREASFSLLIEPIIFIILIVLVYLTKETSFELINLLIPSLLDGPFFPIIILLSFALFIVLLVEGSRIPIDDPNTHLELTMIHEVMILDHSSLDLCLMLYAHSLKVWFFSSFIGMLLIVFKSDLWFVNLLIGISFNFIIAICIGLTESIFARVRMDKLPTLIFAGIAMAILALIMLLR